MPQYKFEHEDGSARITFTAPNFTEAKAILHSVYKDADKFHFTGVDITDEQINENVKRLREQWKTERRTTFAQKVNKILRFLPERHRQRIIDANNAMDDFVEEKEGALVPIGQELEKDLAEPLMKIGKLADAIVFWHIDIACDMAVQLLPVWFNVLTTITKRDSYKELKQTISDTIK